MSETRQNCGVFYWHADDDGATQSELNRPALDRYEIQADGFNDMPLIKHFAGYRSMNPSSNGLARQSEVGAHPQMVQRQAGVPDTSLQLALEVPAQSEQTTHTSSGNTSMPSNGNLDDLIEKLWRKLMSKLAIEQERRGLTRWH